MASFLSKMMNLIAYIAAAALTSLILLDYCHGFQQVPAFGSYTRTQFNVVGRREAATARAFKEEKPKSFLLDEFKTYAGEVVNPYKVLKISREADTKSVRKAYIELSKRYHPDKVMHRDILPGKCDNMEDVRDEWERIKLSYEILRDKKTRQRYDRHEMLADPGAAMSRAAVGAVGKGITGLGKGIFDMGAFAFNKVAGGKTKEE